MAAVIGVHAAIIYLLAVSMGVVDAPKLAQPIEAIFIPEPTQPEREEPAIKPEIQDIELPAEQPPPDIQFDETIVPPAEQPMPSSNNAIAATEVAGQPRNLQAKTRIEPAYPPASRRAGEEGRVRLRVLVDESGRPSDVQVAQSSGFSRLDEAAKQAVRRWRFQAANDGNGPISAWTQVLITFRLSEP